jgi:hypothetical protein
MQARLPAVHAAAAVISVAPDFRKDSASMAGLFGSNHALTAGGLETAAKLVGLPLGERADLVLGTGTIGP